MKNLENILVEEVLNNTELAKVVGGAETVVVDPKAVLSEIEADHKNYEVAS